jgi:hypothetical protein
MRLLLVFLIFFSLPFVFSQTIKEKDSIVQPYKKAMLYSAIIPGGGQIFTSFKSEKKFKNAFWKVPLIYTGLGFIGNRLAVNQITAKSLKTEYSNRQNGGALNQEWIQYDDYSVLALYNSYLNNRDLSILGLAAVYLIQIIDAGVEAHFLKFDVSPNLTLKFDATLMSSNSPGIRLNLTFH